MYCSVKELSVEQRHAFESLLGRPLRDDEGLAIQPSVIVKSAPEGADRERAFREYLAHLDKLADRVKDIPEDEIDAVIDEAVDDVRRRG